MSDIQTVRANIRNATAKNTTAIGMLEQAKKNAEDALADFNRVTEGSGQADVGEATNLGRQAVTKIAEAQQALQAANASAEGVERRL